jgi:hypothetical protein
MIMEGGPVETAFTVYTDFENYAGGVYTHTSGSMAGGHAVKIVGWGVDSGTKCVAPHLLYVLFLSPFPTNPSSSNVFLSLDPDAVLTLFMCVFCCCLSQVLEGRQLVEPVLG